MNNNMSAVDVLAVKPRVITPHKNKAMKAMLRTRRLEIVEIIDRLRRDRIEFGVSNDGWVQHDLKVLLKARRETLRRLRRELNACLVQKYSNISPASKDRALARCKGE